MIRQRNPIKRSTTPIARESEKAKARRLARTGRVLTHEPANSKIANIADSAIPEFRKRPKAKKKRTAAEERAKHEREYGTDEHSAFIRSRPCLACGRTPSECAHLGNEGAGTGRKANADQQGPLCGPRYQHEGCHRESHRIGIKTFAAKHGIDIAGALETVQSDWRVRLAALEGAAHAR